MWSFAKDLFYRGWKEALANGSSTGISVFWLGFGVLVLGFIFTVGIEWLTGGRNMAALVTALKSWRSWAGATLALAMGWLCLLAYSTLGVAYHDHQTLTAAANKVCPAKEEPKTNFGSNASAPPRSAKAPTVSIKQSGKGNTANPGTVQGPINQGPCSNFQLGGSNNQQESNCKFDNPPPNIKYKKTESDGSVELQIWVDKPYPDAKFAVLCDRPCKAVDGKIDWGGRHPGIRFSPEVEVGIIGTPGEHPDIAVFLVDQPPVFGTDISLTCTVKSADGLPFAVTGVRLLNIEPKH